MRMPFGAADPTDGFLNPHRLAHPPEKRVRGPITSVGDTLMQELQSFDFEGTRLRVFGDMINPLFAAADICSALGITNTSMAISKLADFEKTQIDIGQGPAINAVNESGLYTLILRSRDAVKEGTPAYRFRVKVTAEILPSIRRTGSYTCPVAATLTIDAAQQLAVKKAVARRAKNVAVHYQTIYRALYDRFQVPRYTELLRSDFDEAIRFIETCEIRPQIETSTSVPEGYVLLSVLEIERIRGLVYRLKYLHRPELDAFLQFLRLVNSPLAPRFWEFVNDLGITLLEKTLEKHGFAVTDMDCFKALTSR